jgi:plasmid maintenance system antidote protein VapI
MRHLWRALEFPTSAAFAAAIGATATRWNNIENSGSLSREIAFRIVQKFPGVTTDYLWFGRMDGMPLQRVRQFEAAPGAPAKSRTRS